MLGLCVRVRFGGLGFRVRLQGHVLRLRFLD